jgi:hypothetical protein
MSTDHHEEARPVVAAYAAERALLWGHTAQPSSQQTLLVNSHRSISNAMGVSFSRGIYLVSLAFKCRV